MPAGARRYLVDFNGDDLPYYLSDPQLVQVDASVSAGQVTRAFVLPNPAIGGFRACDFYGDGSLYVVAGGGLNYQRANDITLAPIRTGVGLRAGASIGYLSYTREKRINPF